MNRIKRFNESLEEHYLNKELMQGLISNLSVDLKEYTDRDENQFTIRRYYVSKDLVDMAYIQNESGSESTLIINVNSSISKELKKFVGPNYKKYIQEFGDLFTQETNLPTPSITSADPEFGFGKNYLHM